MKKQTQLEKHLAQKELMQSKLSKFDGWQKRNLQIKRHNGKLVVWIDECCNVTATSYGHWTFVENMKGLYIFNDYNYSNTTSKHQWTMKGILQGLGISYISVSYHDSLSRYGITLEKILNDKVNELYFGENAESLSRATKYAAYTESSFNRTMKEIKAIQSAIGMKDKVLADIMMKAEDKANELLIDKLVTDHERRLSRKAVQVLNNDLSPIEL
jgi:hypothetical protein